MLAGDAFGGECFFKQIAELALQQSVIAAGFLLLAQLQSITNQLGLAILTMLAGSEVPLFDGTLFGVAALPFEEQLHSLSPAQPADRANIFSHSLSNNLLSKGAVYSSKSLRPAFYRFTDDCPASNAPAFWRPATIMWYRRPIFNRPYFNPRCRERTHGGFPAGARTTHSHFHRSQPVLFGFRRGRQRRLLRGERSSLARSTESERSRA